jgi:hypothetical protein
VHKKLNCFKNLFREGGAKNIDYARLGRATKRGNQGLYQEGLEALKKTLKGKKDGGRIGYAIGGLTDRAQGIYNSMINAGFGEQAIIDTLNQMGLYNQDTPVVTTPEVVNTQPNIINQQMDRGGGDGTTTPPAVDPYSGLGYSSANFGLSANPLDGSNVMDYEADAYEQGRTFTGQLNKIGLGIFSALKNIPTPFNIVRMGIQKAQEIARQKEIEREAQQAAIARDIARENEKAGTGGYQAGYSSDFMGGPSGAGYGMGAGDKGGSDTMGSFAKGGRVGYQAGGVATPEQYAAALGKVSAGTQSQQNRSLAEYVQNSLGLTQKHFDTVNQMKQNPKQFGINSQFDYAKQSGGDLVKNANPFVQPFVALGQGVASPIYDYGQALKKYSDKGYQGEFGLSTQGILDFGKNLLRVGQEFAAQKPIQMALGRTLGGAEAIREGISSLFTNPSQQAVRNEYLKNQGQPIEQSTTTQPTFDRKATSSNYIGPYGDGQKYSYIFGNQDFKNNQFNPDDLSASYKNLYQPSLPINERMLDYAFNNFKPLQFIGESGYPETTYSDNPISLKQLQEFKSEIGQLQNMNKNIPQKYIDKINEAIMKATPQQPTPDAGTDRPTMADVAGPATQDDYYAQNESAIRSGMMPAQRPTMADVAGINLENFKVQGENPDGSFYTKYDIPSSVYGLANGGLATMFSEKK